MIQTEKPGPDGFVICYLSFVIRLMRRWHAGGEAVRNRVLRRTSPIQSRKSRRQSTVPRVRPNTPFALWSNRHAGYHPKVPPDAYDSTRIRVPLSALDRSQ